jgi:hypothetical protein
MVSVKWLKWTGLGLAVAMALSLPGAANAQYWRGGYYRGGSGISPGAAVGIGLGSFALGTALGSGAFAQPWGYPSYGYYAPAPVYYAPPPVYPYPRTCWYPQFGGYYAC